MRKLEALKVGGVQRGKKMHFVSWKACFSSCYFCIAPFPSHFKDDFYSLSQRSHNILNHSKWSTDDEDLKKCSVIS
jgi:hypothetical protein